MASVRKNSKLTAGAVVFLLSLVIVIALQNSVSKTKKTSEPAVLATTSVPFSGYAEKEPNNDWTAAKANGYVSLNSGVVYGGSFDGNVPIGSDMWYVYVGNTSTTRSFTLTPASTSGVQMVLYRMPAVGDPVAVASDLTAPFSFTYTFTTIGDYELVVHASPTVNNTRSYLLNISDPNVAAKCPWLGPVTLTGLPGTGSIQTFSEFIIGGSTVFQTYWRGSQAWARSVPISNGIMDISQATAWTGPTALTGYPGTGTVQAQSEAAVGTSVKQTFWRGDQGWWRYAPIVNNAPQWTCAN